MVTSIRHCAFVVRDIEESLKYYSDILELKVWKRYIEEGPFIDKLTGIENVNLEWVKLVIPEGGLIELIQYHSIPDPVSSHRATMASSNKIGCSHVALTVKDLDSLYNKIVLNGYNCKSEPLIAPGGKAKILYCHDPDGAILELIQDL